jgi:serine/threonine protein kinase
MYPQVFGKYILERELARGGMARVLLATLRGAGGFEKRLVVKQIRDELAFDQEFVRRFVEEAKTTVALSHPNIVPVYELGVEQGTYFLAMELVDGVSVAELLQASREAGERALSPEEGAYVGVEICRALEYAHRRMNVVHRDVTPRNVMIDEEGQVRVIDFGIAAPASVAGHEVFGSPGHMPPEQVAGKELGPETDIFAVAVLLMEAWSGAAPFRRATVEACDAAMRAPHPRPSAIDIRLLPLDEVIERAMALDPRVRPRDADELGKALRRFTAGIDLQDVARALGERVRAARSAQARADQETRAGAEGTAPAREPLVSEGELGTKTFAARQEVSVWTTSGAPEKVKSPPTMDPATRRLEQSVPPPPKMPAAMERIATGSLERGPMGGRGARNALIAAIAVCLVALAYLGLPLLEQATTTAAAPPAESSTPPAAPSVMAPGVTTPGVGAAASSGAPADSGRPPRAPAAPPSGSAAVAPSTASAASSPSAPVGASLARLSLFGDPGTRVSVDGAPRGACPVRDLALEPGAHDVRFSFDPTGESRGERIVVAAGERVTVRADFAGATPTLRVQR